MYSCNIHRPVSPERVLQQPCQFGVSVRHMSGAFTPVSQSADDVSQGELVPQTVETQRGMSVR